MEKLSDTMVLAVVVAVVIMASNSFFIVKSAFEVCRDHSPLLCSTTSLASVSYFGFLGYMTYISFKRERLPSYKELPTQPLLMASEENSGEP